MTTSQVFDLWVFRAQLDLRVDGEPEYLDGDTLRLLCDQNLQGRQREDVRLENVTAPELREPGGPETRAFVLDWYHAHAAVPDATGRPRKWPLVARTRPNTVAEPQSRRNLVRYIGTIWALDRYDGEYVVTGACLNDDVRAFLLAHPDWGGGVGG